MIKILILFVMICMEGSVFSQNTQVNNVQNATNDLWIKSSNLKSASAEVVHRNIYPSKYELYTLNLSLLKEKLKTVNKRGVSGNESNVIISFPNDKGLFEDFLVMESSVMEPKLQEKYPEIQSYIGKGISNPGSVARFCITPLGLHGYLLSATEPTVIIDPHTKDKSVYMVYLQKDLSVIKTSSENDVLDLDANFKKNALSSPDFNGFNDSKHRTFRLALAATGEYSQGILRDYGVLESATDEYKKTIVLSKLNSIMMRVNAVFERDLCLTLNLVGDNSSLIFLDTISDGYTDYDAVQMIYENRYICDTIIGNANYDIGHVISKHTPVSLGSLGSVCIKQKKAYGVTYGDAEHYVLLHEMGHQFGADHSFNSCTTESYYSSIESAAELGCGSTIMSYGWNDETLFFHSISMQQIWQNITLGTGQCASVTTIGNIAPIVSAGNDFIIPKLTPFILEGTATDNDTTNKLTYSWEQMDTEQTIFPPVSEATGGPVFFWRIPSRSPNRYMPELSTTLSGLTASENEALPSVARELTFNFVVNNNSMYEGQIAIDRKVIWVDSIYGPFVVTSDSNPETWSAGAIKTITWNFAGADGDTSYAKFDITLSTDGGYTYPIKLASNVPNYGSYNIVVPLGVNTTSGRYMIRAVNNIFFAVNLANITIIDSNTGIEINKEYKNLKVYPNPFYNELIMEMEGNKNPVNYELLNALGEVILKGNFIFKTKINTSDYLPGVYIMKVENQKTFKLIK